MTLQRYLARLIWWCVTPLLALAIALGYLHFQKTRQDNSATAQWQAQMLARGIEQMTVARLTGLQALASSPLVDDESLWPELHREAQGFATAFGSAVLLVDSQRQMRLHSAVRLGQALPPLTVPAGRSAVAEAFETSRPAVGDPFNGPIARQPVVALAVPVLREGRARWVLVSVAPLTQLEGLLQGLSMPPGWKLAIRDSTGQVIVQRGDPDGVAQGTTAAGLRFVERPDGVPWSVEVHIPSSIYAWNLLGVALELTVALLGVTLFSVIGAQRATRRLARSVRSLAVPTGTPAPPDDVDEIRETRRLLLDARQQHEADAESLAMREAQLRGIFESASEAILTADTSQTIVLANPAAARVFGLPVERLVGLPLSDLVPERFRARHRIDIDHYGLFDRTPRGMGRLQSVLALRADGREFPIEAAISQVDAAGQRLYTVIVRDITERVEAQAEIEASRARLRATLESMDDGLAIADTGHRIVEVNAALVRMYGFSGRADFLRPIVDFQDRLEMSTLDGRVLTPAQWTMPRALRGERGNGLEMTVRHKDTGRRWIASFSFAPIRGADGEIAGAVFSVRDVTEQKRLADELKASHRDLERLLASQNNVQEAERQRIARELHDELQQVLAALKMDIASILPELQAHPARLPALIERMDELTTAAVTSSRRIVNDLRPPLLEEFGLAAALQQLAARFMERNPMVVSVESDTAGADVEPDPSVALCLYRVAQEALNNVAKHSEASRVRIRLARTLERGWVLTIADDGRGFQPEDRRKPASFGLRGMAERVRALGGGLDVRSDPGHGVVVTARLGAGTGPGAAA